MDCQWATLGWNQKKVGAWSLTIRFSDGSIFKLFIKSEMHKLFINRAKGAKVEPDIKYIKKWSQIPQACIVQNWWAPNLIPFFLKNSLLTLSTMALSQPTHSLCFTAFPQLFSRSSVSPPYKILFPLFFFLFSRYPKRKIYPSDTCHPCRGHFLLPSNNPRLFLPPRHSTILSKTANRKTKTSLPRVLPS